MSTQQDITDRSRGPAEPTGGDAVHRPTLAALAIAGIVGSLGFLVVTAVLGLSRQGYSFVAQPVVALVDGPNGWMQHLNLAVLGSLVIACAVGLHLGARPTRWGWLGPALLVLSGTGPVLAGVTTPIPPHFVLTFVGAGAAFIVLSRRMAQDPRWQGFAGYTLASGIAILIVFPVHSVLALPANAPLHPWWGLLNWLAVVLWLAGTAVLALRLLWVARAVTPATGT